MTTNKTTIAECLILHILYTYSFAIHSSSMKSLRSSSYYRDIFRSSNCLMSNHLISNFVIIKAEKNR